ncbi:MAG: sigma-E factor negative regulatory protein [Sinobacterium sp.]|nr:sigma-E factor negative regulatory protein [Sinobacterium sp.]
MSDNKPGVPDVSASNPRGEMLSALLDGEASDFEARRLIQTLTEEDEQSWRSYSLIQQAMHSSGSDGIDLSIDISSAVSAAIADEPAMQLSDDKVAPPEQVSQPKKVSYFKPAMGFAAAAAFAFVSVINLESFKTGDGQAGFVAQGNVSASQLPIQSGVGLSAVSAQAQLPAGQSLPVDGDALDQDKLDEYLQRHAEQSAINNGRGLMPMVRTAKDDY